MCRKKAVAFWVAEVSGCGFGSGLFGRRGKSFLGCETGAVVVVAPRLAPSRCTRTQRLGVMCDVPYAVPVLADLGEDCL